MLALAVIDANENLTNIQAHKS